MKKRIRKISSIIVVVAMLSFIIGCTATIVGGGGTRHCRRWCHNGWCSRHCWVK